MNNCKNCDEKISGNYCQNCGSPREIQRIDRRYIFDEISSVVNFDKGIFYTIRELFIRPGVTVHKFIDGDRKRIVKPIIFLIICSLIYSIAQQFFGFETGYISYDVDDIDNTPILVNLFEWFSSNLGYANILMAVFIALWIKILFRKHVYNYYEIYILLCFVIGNSILIYALLGIIESLVGYPILQLGIFITLVYTTWSIGRFFGRKNKINYFKGLMSYILGTLTCMIVFFTIGNGLDNLLQ